MSEQKTFAGGCLCGAIRYESTQPPTMTGMCHCRMCQRWTGTVGVMVALFDTGSFRFTQGQPKVYKSSAILERSFCGDCGSSLMHRYVVPPYGPDIARVEIGTLDDPAAVDSPRFHFGVESHLEKWITLEEGTRCLRAEGDPGLARAWDAVEGNR